MMTGSGIAGGAVFCGGFAATRLKFGQEKSEEKSGQEKFAESKSSKFGKDERSNVGKETRSNSGKARRSNFGMELAVAAPMTASAARDTTVTVRRPEAPC